MEIRILTERDVYEPAADTELLVRSIRFRQGDRVLEIGTGTGVVAIHCAKHGCHVTATDVVERALELASENARKNSVDVDLLEGDMFEPVTGRYDVIIFNPPYLPTAPEDLTHSDLDKALDGGPDGTDVTVMFLEQLGDYLTEDGRAYLVVSSLQDLGRIDDVLHEQHLVARRRGSERFDFETVSVLEVRKPPKEARPGGAGAV